MSKDSYEETTARVNEAQMELKIRLEQVSRLRNDCARLQLELLRLYRPRCLEILELLQDVSEPVELSDRIRDAAESRDNDEGNEVLRTNGDVLKKSAT
ncbi:PREDICTED: uncharacterized protein LOC105567503 [Vollenhovia emeryi]|uniref:uncharacterized protein LOC105567503 n=1 Tax=Vollenhovia emeryi TaxID=411798 RepID=UPI0005F50EDB|nr:PREDICTED: uncharacterized protein LOC105567503 [Vollenhovia emeryi]